MTDELSSEPAILKLFDEPASVKLGVLGIMVMLVSAGVAIATAHLGLRGQARIFEALMFAGFVLVFPISMIVGSLEEHGILPGREEQE